MLVYIACQKVLPPTAINTFSTPVLAYSLESSGPGWLISWLGPDLWAGVLA
ncbi:MAG: hypothetical protein ACFCBU_01450 [Cyanophyceae cyanobacterium]